MSLGYENAPATALVASFCACCARPLVDADSVETGMGPSCRKKHGYARPDGACDWAAVEIALRDVLVIPEGRGERGLANTLVQRIACDQNGPRIGAYLLALRALGYVKLAERISERVGCVRVKVDAGRIVVRSPRSEAFIAACRSVPGARWDGARRLRTFPVSARRQVWEAIRIAYAGGTLLVGEKLSLIA